jgi:polyhydroxyalkanoate synthase
MHHTVDIHRLSHNSLKIFEKYQILLSKIFKNDSFQNQESLFEPIEINKVFIDVFSSLYSHPKKMLELQAQYVKDYIELLNYSLKKFSGENPEPLYQPTHKDKRFIDKAWDDNFFFDLVKQTYLMNTQWLETLLKDAKVENKTKLRANFFIKQMMNALAPSNFISTNPIVLKETIETHGENLLKGLNNFIEDLENSKQIFDIKRIDNKAFKIGKNIANTKGQVIYENELMQLIHYTPTTDQTYSIPLLIVPPWINKYYILDLTEKDSFVKWILDQGFSVFLISWVNPDSSLANKSFDDYMLQGPIEAINFIKKITGTKHINLLGYCLGGTLSCMTEAYLNSKGDDTIKSATLLTTLLDFKDAGDILVFIDDAKLKRIEEKMSEDGYYDGDYVSATFSLLRSNDMIWSFFVNNYLLGKEPLPFDILYWNADSTRLPAKMHSFYLKNMYLENNLAKPNKLKIAGTPINLANVKIPCYFLTAIDDHIAPWEAVYQAHKLISGPIKFTLSGSGHVGGVVNPPSKNKYCYWTNKANDLTGSKWLSHAIKHEGSWWPDWANWLKDYSGKLGKPISATDMKKYFIENAPGRYVLVK